MRWLLLGDFLSTWGYSQVLALLNLHLLEQGFTLGTIGFANSVSFLVGSLLAIPAGFFADLYGYRTGLALSFMALGAATWLKLSAHSPTLLFVAFGLVGAATALSGAAKTPAVTSLTPPSRLPSALALCRALASIAAVGGGLAAAWLSAQTGGQVMALWVGACITSLAFLPMLALPKDYQNVRFLLFSAKRFGMPASMPLLPFVLFCVAGSCVFPFINIALTERGIPASGIGLSFAAFQAASVLVWPLTRCLGRGSATFGLRVSLLGLLVTCGWLFYLRPLHFWWPGWLAWHVCIGAAYSFFYAGFGGAGNNKGSFFGLLGLLQMTAAAAGSWCGGMIAEIATRWTFVLAGLLFLLALLSLRSSSSVVRQ